MPPTRIYADTSVYGGCFDPEFQAASRLFFDQVRQGRFRLVASPLVEEEIDGAPPRVVEHFRSLAAILEVIAVTPAARQLQRAYLDAGIVSERSAEDALHVALATIHACPILVSWNYKHIVHIEKGPRYNAVNMLRGLPAVAIAAPAEVVRYEEGL